MFPGTWGCPRHVRFACHTSSMHIQSTKAKSKHQKLQYLFLISSKLFMVSKFNIYTVHLKCFESIRYHLNQYTTLTKNFNQGLNSGEQGNQRWQTSPAAPPGGLGHGNVHVKFHDDRLRNGGDITY